MADDAPGGAQGQVPSDPQTPATVDPQTPGADHQAPVANDSDLGQEPTAEPFDQERALATIRKLRGFEKTADKLSRELEAYKQREREAEMAKLSEQERLQAQLRQREAELEFERQQARDRMNQYELQLQASRQGVVDPEAAAKLLNWADLEYDDDGRPTNLAEALSDLLERKPYLRATQPADPPAPQRAPVNPTNPTTRTPPSGSRIYTAAEIADRAFYQANKAEIMQAIREGRFRDE